MTETQLPNSIALNLEHVNVAYNGNLALEDITVQIPAGTRVAIIGPNGAGKSTLFKAIVGLVPLASGKIEIRGTDARLRQPAQVAYVAQREEIDWRFPLRVGDIVLMGRYPSLGWLKRPGARDCEIASEAIEKVGLTDLTLRRISNLSGGQQQRVFLARAWAQDADIYLLDEPFTGVDAATAQIINDTLAELQARGKTILVATHDLESVIAHFADVLCMNRRLCGYGPIHDVLTPEHLADTFGHQLTFLEMGDRHIAAIGGSHGHFG
jgi:manganese/zinc/iron transport system ATP- binding protein